MNKFFSLLLLILLSPFFSIVAIIIYFFDGLPVIFKQKRIGLNNDYFTIYKFRTMRNDMKDIPTHLLNTNENYYIRWGLIIRNLSFDELPQLFNILKGDMVFIGPRPALYNQTDLIEERTKLGIQKLIPGITGWAQVNGRDEISIKKKVKLDAYYLQNRSIFLNLKIILLTIFKIIFIKNIK